MLNTIKRTNISGFYFGAGFAITLSLIIGGYLWYSSKPKSPKPWNSIAITATNENIDTEGVNNTLVFYYTMQNNTDFDYNIDDVSTITLMYKNNDSKSLAGSKNDRFLKIDYPLFLPAKHRLRFAIHLLLPYDKFIPNIDKSEFSTMPDDSDHKKFCKELATSFKENLPKLNGFVLFDETNRYQIDFPGEW